MAFDKPDTDRLYAQSIVPVLRQLNVKPVRIDRVEHNDDIDDRIIQEIGRSDLLLADLTYARPSVYFEAGYGQRAIPVIYTARADHFLARDTDPNGNLRVHFDLQMKNIISWPSPASSIFRRRLGSRIRKVLRPIIEKAKNNQASEAKVAEFQNQSVIEKGRLLRSVFRGHFEPMGYEVVDFSGPAIWSTPPDYLAPEVVLDFRQAMLARKRIRGGVYHIVFIDVVPRLTRKLVNLYRSQLVRLPAYRVAFRPPERAPRQLREDYLICSLDRSSFRSLGEGLPQFKSDGTASTATWHSTFSVTTPNKVANTPRSVTFHLLHSPSRLVNLAEELRLRF